MSQVPKDEGANENHFFLAVAALIMAGLIWLGIHDPDLPLAELIGQKLLPLGIFLLVVILILTALGGWRFRIVYALKDSPFALSLLTSAIILGSALVLAHG